MVVLVILGHSHFHGRVGHALLRRRIEQLVDHFPLVADRIGQVRQVSVGILWCNAQPILIGVGEIELGVRVAHEGQPLHRLPAPLGLAAFDVEPREQEALLIVQHRVDITARDAAGFRDHFILAGAGRCVAFLASRFQHADGEVGGPHGKLLIFQIGIGDIDACDVEFPARRRQGAHRLVARQLTLQRMVRKSVVPERLARHRAVFDRRLRQAAAIHALRNHVLIVPRIFLPGQNHEFAGRQVAQQAAAIKRLQAAHDL